MAQSDTVVRNWRQPCAVVVKDTIIAASDTLDPTRSFKLDSQFWVVKANPEFVDPGIGFDLSFPFSDKQAANEDTGAFGAPKVVRITQTSALASA